MQLAQARVVLDRFGSSVAKTDITPAEAQVLKAIHETNVGSDPVVELKVTGDAEATVLTGETDSDGNMVEKQIPRSDRHEIRRLIGIYGVVKISKLFPGANPVLPKTFAEIEMTEGNAYQASTKAPEQFRITNFPANVDAKTQAEYIASFKESVVSVA